MSYDVWKGLQSLFNAKSRSRRLTLRHELSHMRKDGLTAEQYLVAISQKADEVRAEGITVEDEELALFTMDGLDSSYDAFVTKVTTSTGDISFTEFKGLLRAHESRILRQSQLPPPSASYLKATSHLPLPSTNYSQVEPQAAQQPTKNIPQLLEPSLGLICQICQKQGHSTLACFNRHNDNQYPGNQGRGRYRGHDSYNNKIPYADMAWYADTGCTDHATNNEANIVEKDSTRKETSLIVANGSIISVNNTGNTTVNCNDRNLLG